MAIVLDGTNGITTPDLESSGPVSGTTANFSGNVTLGSSVLATPTGSAPSYTCRAWVNFNGTGTVAIVGSGNVSSITDNGTGNYTVNFTTAMSDANYSCVASTDPTGGSSNISAGPVVFSTGSVQVATELANGVAIDRSIFTVAIFR
jgi:hypothetical protein